MKIVLGHNPSSHIPIEIDVKELLISNLLVEGATRSGKSYAVRKLLELLASIVQIIIIDPEGELASLREKFDFLYAGPNELPMSIHTAEELARSLVETRASCICDLSELKVTERKHWVRIFVESLMESPKSTWDGEKIVFIDEAHLFAPEKDKAESLAAVVDLAGRGQKRGFTLICATQRISKLSKDVISELQNVMVGRHTLDIDRERAAETLGVSRKEMPDFMAKIKILPRGTFFGLGSAIADEMVAFKVDQVVTTHPERGKKLTVPPPPSAKVKQLLERLKDLPAKVEKKLKTEQDLRERIAELEDEVRDNQRRAAEPERVEVEVVREVPIVPVDLLESMRARLLDNLSDTLNTIRTSVDAMIAYKPQEAEVKACPAPGHVYQGPINRISTREPNIPSNGNSSHGELPKGEAAILNVIAQSKDGVFKDRITVMTGYKRSARDTYIQRLSARGFVQRGHGDRIVATPSGKAALGSALESLPTGKRLQDYWLARLPKGEAAVLGCLIRHYPRSVTKDLLQQATQYKRSATDTYVQRLGARELVESAGRGEVKVSSALF